MLFKFEKIRCDGRLGFSNFCAWWIGSDGQPAAGGALGCLSRNSAESSEFGCWHRSWGRLISCARIFLFLGQGNRPGTKNFCAPILASHRFPVENFIMGRGYLFASLAVFFQVPLVDRIGLLIRFIVSNLQTSQPGIQPLPFQLQGL